MNNAVSRPDPAILTSVADYHARATALYEEDRLEEAETLCREAVRAYPREAFLQAALGSVLSELGKVDKAGDAYDKAVQLYQQQLLEDPSNIQHHRGYARLLIRLMRVDEAEEAYRTAVLAFPADAKLHFSLGSLLRDRDRVAEAEMEFRAALACDPSYGSPCSALADLLKKQDRQTEMRGVYEELEGKLRKSILGEPASTSRSSRLTHLALAQVLDKLGEFAEAKSVYQNAVVLFDDDRFIKNRLRTMLIRQVRAHIRDGNLDLAEAWSRDAVQADSDHADTFATLGRVLLLQFKYSEAESAYRDAIRLAPDHARHYLSLAETLEAQGKMEEADIVFDEAKAIQAAKEFEGG